MKLKMRFLPVLVAAFLFGGVASAQHSSSPSGHVTFGIKGGVNFYNIQNDNSTTYSQRTGYHFGMLGHIHRNSQWAVQPELVYSAQGSKNLNLGYLNIPVLIQYMFDNGFRLQAGPQIGFLVSSENSDNWNPIDLALSVGASYVFPATGFGVDLRYNHGLNDINKNNDVVSTNRGIQLGLFYLFGHDAERAVRNL
jgi:hypothetical protein